MHILPSASLRYLPSGGNNFALPSRGQSQQRAIKSRTQILNNLRSRYAVVLAQPAAAALAYSDASCGCVAVHKRRPRRKGPRYRVIGAWYRVSSRFDPVSCACCRVSARRLFGSENCAVLRPFVKFLSFGSRRRACFFCLGSLVAVWGSFAGWKR